MDPFFLGGSRFSVAVCVVLAATGAMPARADETSAASAAQHATVGDSVGREQEALDFLRRSLVLWRHTAAGIDRDGPEARARIRESLRVWKLDVLRSCDLRLKAHVLIGIADAQFALGDLVAAGDTLSDAGDVVERFTDATEQFAARAAITALAAEVDDAAASGRHAGNVGSSSPPQHSVGNRVAPASDRQLEQLAHAQFAQGETVRALASADRMVSFSARAALLSQIALAQAKAGDLAGALRTGDSVSNEAFPSIAEFEAASGRYGVARQIVREIASDDTRQATTAGIAAAQCRDGDIVGARKTAMGISRDVLRLAALTNVARAQASAGDTVGASTTMRDADRIARSLPANREAFEYLYEARVEAQAGNTLGAQTTARSATRDFSPLASVSLSGFAGGWSSFAEAYVAAIAAEARAGKVDVARRSAHAIADSNARARALAAISCVQASSGNIPGARNTAGSIDRNRFALPVLLNVAGAQATAGDAYGASATLRGARAAAAGLVNEGMMDDCERDVARYLLGDTTRRYR